MTLKIEHHPKSSTVTCEAWTFELHKDGRRFRLFPSAQWTYDLVFAIMGGRITWKQAGEVYKAWLDERLLKVISGLELLGVLKPL